MRYLIYIVLLFFVACSKPDPKLEFIKNTSLSICDINIYLGQKVSPLLFENEYILAESSLDEYSISCKDRGILYIGSGHDQSQIIFIDEASFSLYQDSTIYDIQGIWRTTEDEPGSLNDLSKSRYEIEQAIGKASSIRPVLWEKGPASLRIGSISRDQFTYNYVTAALLKDEN